MQRDLMAPDPILHEQIYAALKSDIRDARLIPGQHIDLQAISDRHHASVTPVREAVCRLIGEGVAEFQRYGGFRIAPLGAAELADLYALNTIIICAAIRGATDAALDQAVGTVALPGESGRPIDLARAVASLFASLAIASGNRQIVKAVEGSNDRLAAARILEAEVLKDARREYLMLTHGPSGQLRKTLTGRVTQYHRRRLAQSEAIVAMLQHIVPSDMLSE
jgi:DNA-binding GntR family transcriptional regulator